MTLSRNFKNGPLSPMGDRPLVAQATGDRDLSVIFFSKLANRSLGSAAWGLGGRGPVAPPTGDRVPPLYNVSLFIPSSFEPKNSTKNPKKR